MLRGSVIYFTTWYNSNYCQRLRKFFEEKTGVSHLGKENTVLMSRYIFTGDIAPPSGLFR